MIEEFENIEDMDNPKTWKTSTTLTKLQKCYLQDLEATAGLISEAARLGNMERSKHHYWYRHVPEYKAAVKEIREAFVCMAETTIKQAVLKGDVDAAKFILRYLGKDRGYAEESVVDVNMRQTVTWEFANPELNKFKEEDDSI